LEPGGTDGATGEFPLDYRREYIYMVGGLEHFVIIYIHGIILPIICFKMVETTNQYMYRCTIAQWLIIFFLVDTC
jgi:hypothetical protein